MRKLITFLALGLLAIPPAYAVDQNFASSANALCRTIIDARDYDLFFNAKRASLDLVLARLQSHDSPPTAEREQLATALEEIRTEILATKQQILALADDYPEHAEDLALFAEHADYYIHVISTRIPALRASGSLVFPTESEIDAPSLDFAAWDQATVRLGFANRDCQPVFSSNGNPPDMADFISTVAPACSIALDDLLATDQEQWREHNLNAMIATMQKKPQDPEAIPALRALGAAWTNAAHVFRLVDSKIVEKPIHWEETIASLYDRARIFKDRADALEYRDDAAISEAFASRLQPVDFKRLGLEETSCVALETLM